MARLAAPHGRRDPARGPCALSVGEGAPAEHDRDALRLSPAGLDPAWRAPRAGDRRLRAMDSGMRQLLLTRPACGKRVGVSGVLTRVQPPTVEKRAVAPHPKSARWSAESSLSPQAGR